MADDEDSLLALAAVCIVIKLKQQRRKRRFWQHPINANRESQGDYDNLILELRQDSFLFQRYFRMSTNEFDELLSRIGPAIMLKKRKRIFR